MMGYLQQLLSADPCGALRLGHFVGDEIGNSARRCPQTPPGELPSARSGLPK